MRKIMLFILMLLCMIGMASAVTVNLDPSNVLRNLTYKNTSTIYPNINITGNSTVWSCILYGNQNGSNGVGVYREIETDSAMANGTFSTNFSTWLSLAEITGYQYCWDVFCNSTNDTTGDWGGASNSTQCSSHNFSVDTTAPSLTVTPADYTWDVDGSINITATVTENNPDKCQLSTTMNWTTNQSMANNTYALQTYTNATAFMFPGFNGTLWNDMDDNNTNAYYYEVTCNDSAGFRVSTGQRFVLVDTVAPDKFSFNLTFWRTDSNLVLSNNSYSTDYTPQVGWNLTSDKNFSYYRVRFYQGSGYTGSFTETNVTTVTTLRVNSSALAGDKRYTILVTAIDAAGHHRNVSITDYEYNTVITGRNLSAGWNLVGNVGNALSLSEFLNFSGASTVSLWNSSHQFQSHTSGGSNGALSVNPGEVVFLYMDAADQFDDMVRNTSAFTAYGGLVVNITNQTASNWSLTINRNYTRNITFQTLDDHLNSNIAGDYAPQNDTAINSTFFSFYNNSAASGSKYVSFVANWSNYNGTTLRFGEPVWVYLDEAANAQYNVLNWSNVR